MFFFLEKTPTCRKFKVNLSLPCYYCRFGTGGKLAELVESIASKFQTDEMLTEVNSFIVLVVHLNDSNMK